MLNIPALLYNMFLFGIKSILYKIPEFGIPNHLEKTKAQI